MQTKSIIDDRKRKPGLIWRIIRRFNSNAVKVFSRPNPPGPDVLVLTTIGRRSGLPRMTPLQYEEYQGAIVVGAGRGPRTDWLHNLMKTPQVEVQIKGEKFSAMADPITDCAQGADFLEYRLRKHPIMIRAILLTHGLPLFPKRTHIEKLARELVFVRVTRINN
jgi:deazaflavin-dependent oxidoreductase (nitroreductase family)